MSYGARAGAEILESYEKVQLCSGTLVHPRVVVYAAHCLKAGYLRLGEDRNGPLFTLKDGHFEKSNVNPRWMSPGQVGEDWAYVLLKEPIKDVPLIPIAYGCEIDMLIKAGAPVVMAGYSDNEEGKPEDQRDYRQKWAKTKIRDTQAGVINAGGQGVVACKGDSGGPLLAQVPDGSWRMIGIASTRSGANCDSPGAFNRYSRVRKEMVAWLEDETGLDLTPCFDLEGKPTPSAACDAFKAYAGDPSNPKGSWETHCVDAKTLPAKDACGIEDSGEEPEEEDPKDEDPKDEDPKDDKPKEEDPKEEDPGGEEPEGEEPEEEDPEGDNPEDDNPEGEEPEKEDPKGKKPKNKKPKNQKPEQGPGNQEPAPPKKGGCAVSDPGIPTSLGLGALLLLLGVGRGAGRRSRARCE